MPQNIDYLIEQGVLKLGQNAKNNPEKLNLPVFCVGVANEDYSAMTPHLWNSTYQALNIDRQNIRFYGDPIDIKLIFTALKEDPRYVGGDVGVGFKDKVGQFIDEIDPLAQEMESINVIVRSANGNLKGYNTDGLGYALSLEQKLADKGETLAGKKIVMLGGGGTANSIAFALADKRAKIIILNRTVSKAEKLAGRINQFFKLIANQQIEFGGEDLIGQQVKDADVVLNVSTKGAGGDFQQYNALAPAILPDSQENIQANNTQALQVLKSIPKQAIISDVILTKEATPLLKMAQNAGYQTLDGMPMVVNQGIEAFWLVNHAVLEEKGIPKEQVAKIMKKAAGL